MRVAVYWRAAGAALALQPLRCVFSNTEVALLLLLVLLLDEWAAHAGEPKAETRAERDDVEPQRTTSMCSDAIGGTGEAAEAAQAEDSACCCELTDCESMNSCSTSDTVLLSGSSCSHPGRREQTSEFDGTFFASMAISRFSDEFLRDVGFMHKSGELHVRRDSVLNVLKPWRRCSILLSVTSGELFVHRKAKSPPEAYPLSRFTGASIHPSSRHHTFKVMFDGHTPLYFRTAEAREAESWVKALEYAKEATWRMTSS